MGKKDKIQVGKWQDDLKRCPSQCYLNIELNDAYFVLYLRWRWADPWRAHIIQTNHLFDMDNTEHEWVDLEIKDWREDQLEELKADALSVAKKLIYKR